MAEPGLLLFSLLLGHEFPGYFAKGPLTARTRQKSDIFAAARLQIYR
jgi:hypothetical protein